MSTPVWYRLAQVDEALTRHAAHLRIARASGRPYAEAIHWPRVDALLELRAELTGLREAHSERAPVRVRSVLPAPPLRCSFAHRLDHIRREHLGQEAPRP